MLYDENQMSMECGGAYQENCEELKVPSRDALHFELTVRCYFT